MLPEISILAGLTIAGTASSAGQTFEPASIAQSVTIRATQSSSTGRKVWRIDCDDDKRCSYIEITPTATHPAMSIQPRAAGHCRPDCIECTKPDLCGVCDPFDTYFRQCTSYGHFECRNPVSHEVECVEVLPEVINVIRSNGTELLDDTITIAISFLCPDGHEPARGLYIPDDVGDRLKEFRIAERPAAKIEPIQPINTLDKAVDSSGAPLHGSHSAKPNDDSEIPVEKSAWTRVDRPGQAKSTPERSDSGYGVPPRANPLQPIINSKPPHSSGTAEKGDPFHPLRPISVSFGPRECRICEEHDECHEKCNWTYSCTKKMFCMHHAPNQGLITELCVCGQHL